jgi:hypothetical protein
MNTSIAPEHATVTDVVAVIYGDVDLNLQGLDADSPPAKVEAYCREAVRLATPFDAVQLGILEGELLTDRWRVFRRRSLKAMVRGIMEQVKDYQKNARAEARRAKKTQRG